MQEKFSILVIMPLYNKVDYVDDAIQSCLNQTYKDFHLVIVDDCSTDGSSEVIEKYRDNKRITILKNTENKGCYYSRNRALYHFRNHKWKYFTVHDADDTSSNIRFELVNNIFWNNLNLESLITCYQRGDTKIMPGIGIAFFTRNVFNNLGYYDNTRFGGDSEYMERCRYYTKKTNKIIRQIDDPITYFASLNDTNLTNIYDSKVRSDYMKNKKKEIREMIKTNLFYRGFKK